MRLTLRKFYLLMGEWHFQQRVIDERFYKLICAWCTKAPPAGELFPTLNTDENSSGPETDPDLDLSAGDDDLIFQHISASLGAS